MEPKVVGYEPPLMWWLVQVAWCYLGLLGSLLSGDEEDRVLTREWVGAVSLSIPIVVELNLTVFHDVLEAVLVAWLDIGWNGDSATEGAILLWLHGNWLPAVVLADQVDLLSTLGSVLLHVESNGYFLTVLSNTLRYAHKTRGAGCSCSSPDNYVLSFSLLFVTNTKLAPPSLSLSESVSVPILKALLNPKAVIKGCL